MSDTIPDTSSFKQCSKCKELFPATNIYFHKDSRKKDGFHSSCKICKGNKSYSIVREYRLGEKRCTKCKNWHPSTSEFFHSDRNRSDGLFPWCKKCVATPRRREVEIIEMGHKRCIKCKRILPATREYFHVSKTHRYGVQTRCKLCASIERKTYHEMFREDDAIRQKAYRNSHAEENKQRLRAYCKNNPDKYKTYNHNRGARKKAIPGILTEQQIQQKLKAQKYRCYYSACDHAKFEKKNGQYIFHLEHTIPLSRIEEGPRNDVDYVVLSCPTCNLSKHDKLPHEWPEGGRLF